jgi:hypothetical protein
MTLQRNPSNLQNCHQSLEIYLRVSPNIRAVLNLVNCHVWNQLKQCVKAR